MSRYSGLVGIGGGTGGAPQNKILVPLSLGKGEGETEPVLSLPKEGEGL